MAGLAGWRIASLMVSEDGPFSVFARVRAWAGVPNVGPQLPRPFVGGVLSCLWCASVWTSACAWLTWEYLAHWPVAMMAAAAVAIVAERCAHGPR
jgi:hypothetical protein